MGGLGGHYITIQLNNFVKNIIIYKMVYSNQSYIGLNFFLQKNYIFLFLIEYFNIFRGKTQNENIIFELNIKFSTKWYIKHICVKKFKYCFIIF